MYPAWSFRCCCAANVGTNRTAAGPNPRDPAVATILVTPIRMKYFPRSEGVLNHANARWAANISAMPRPRTATPPPPTNMMVSREMGSWSMDAPTYRLIASMKSRYRGPSMFSPASDLPTARIPRHALRFAPVTRAGQRGRTLTLELVPRQGAEHRGTHTLRRPGLTLSPE